MSRGQSGCAYGTRMIRRIESGELESESLREMAKQ